VDKGVVVAVVNVVDPEHNRMLGLDKQTVGCIVAEEFAAVVVVDVEFVALNYS
jgi:hypothetical protein